MNALVREFDTGAKRDLDETKLDFEGFLSPLVLHRYAEYMHANRKMRDGSLRDSDNWQQGIPFASYMKSGWRHFFDWWKEHRGIETPEGLELALCGLIFNASGYLHEVLKAKGKPSAESAQPFPMPLTVHFSPDAGLKLSEMLDRADEEAATEHLLAGKASPPAYDGHPLSHMAGEATFNAPLNPPATNTGD